MNIILTMQTDPEFAQALLGNDLNKLQEILRQRHRHRSEIQRQRDEELVSSLHFWLFYLISYPFNSHALAW